MLHTSLNNFEILLYQLNFEIMKIMKMKIAGDKYEQEIGPNINRSLLENNINIKNY